MPAASSVLLLSAVFVIGWAGCVSAAAGESSLQLTKQLRVQPAAGPSLTWARLTSDGLQADGDAEADDTGQDVSLVPYGRLGVELLLSDRFIVGASVRYADDEFDFGDSGELDVDEVVWLLTLGSRL